VLFTATAVSKYERLSSQHKMYIVNNAGINCYIHKVVIYAST